MGEDFCLKAIPTFFKGQQYRSRLEARFAEYLDSKGINFGYEIPFGGTQDYRPDFFLPGFAHEGLFVEIKPIEFLWEMALFEDDLSKSYRYWVCLDSSGRDSWTYLMGNVSFEAECLPFGMDYPCGIE